MHIFFFDKFAFKLHNLIMENIIFSVSWAWAYFI
jgi:hypothetical protein